MRSSDSCSPPASAADVVEEFWSSPLALSPSHFVANRYQRIEKTSDLPALIDQRPPVIKENVEWPPHRYPTRDDESLSKNLSKGSGRERSREPRKCEEDNEHG